MCLNIPPISVFIDPKKQHNFRQLNNVGRYLRDWLQTNLFNWRILNRYLRYPSF